MLDRYIYLSVVLVVMCIPGDVMHECRRCTPIFYIIIEDTKLKPDNQSSIVTIWTNLTRVLPRCVFPHQSDLDQLGLLLPRPPVRLHSCRPFQPFGQHPWPSQPFQPNPLLKQTIAAQGCFCSSARPGPNGQPVRADSDAARESRGL